MAEKGKIWGKNSYANRLLSYANRFTLMAEANLVQKQLCKSIYTLCKSICTVKLLKNDPLVDILTWYLQNTNIQKHKAIFLVFWLVKHIQVEKHWCLMIPLTDEVSITPRAEL